MRFFGKFKRDISLVSALLLVMFFLVPFFISVSAGTKAFSNLGFTQNGIWYSTDKFLEGEKIKIYTAVFNSSANDLLGAVEFFDNGISVGKAGFYVGGGGKLKEAGIEWTAVKGQHKISAKIKDAKIRMADGQEEAITLENSQTGVSDIFVEGKIIIKEVDKILATTTETFDSVVSTSSSPIISTIANIAGKSAALAVDSVTYVLKKTSKLADSGKQIVDAKKEEMAQEIKEISKDSKTMERPLKSSYLLALSAASIVLNNKILFLLFVAAALFILIKFALKAVSRRKG